MGTAAVERQNVSKGRCVTIPVSAGVRQRPAFSGAVRRARVILADAEGARNSGVIVGHSFTDASMRDLYFIRNRETAAIKIGISGDVQSRLTALESACGVSLELLRVCPGMAKHETELHAAFAEARLKGEWFTATDELTALASGDEPIFAFLARKAFGVSALTPIQRTRNASLNGVTAIRHA